MGQKRDLLEFFVSTSWASIIQEVHSLEIQLRLAQGLGMLHYLNDPFQKSILVLIEIGIANSSSGLLQLIQENFRE